MRAGSPARRSSGRPGIVAGAVNPDPLNNVTWELYDLTKDWTQSNDVAAKHPGQAQGVEGAVPRGGDEVPGPAAGRLGGHPPRDAAAQHHGRPQRVRLYQAADRHSAGRFAAVAQPSYNIKADIEVPEGGAEGMLLTSGGRFGGYGFYLLKGKPVFLWNLVDLKRIRWEGPEALTPGKHTVEFDFKYDGLGAGTLAFNNMSGIGRGGTGVLKVDGKEVATPEDGTHAPADPAVGRDLRHRLRHRHARWTTRTTKCPFTFTGKLNKLTLKIDRPQLSPADDQEAAGGQRNNKASE